MTTIKMKPLHMATTMKELNGLIQLPPISMDLDKLDKYYKSTLKMFDTAVEKKKEGGNIYFSLILFLPISHSHSH